MRAAHRVIRTLHQRATEKKKTVRKPPPLKQRVIHASKILSRVLLAVAAIHFGVQILEHFGVFIKFGRTGELISGSLADYALVGSWEQE